MYRCVGEAPTGRGYMGGHVDAMRRCNHSDDGFRLPVLEPTKPRSGRSGAGGAGSWENAAQPEPLRRVFADLRASPNPVHHHRSRPDMRTLQMKRHPQAIGAATCG